MILGHLAPHFLPSAEDGHADCRVSKVLLLPPPPLQVINLCVPPRPPPQPLRRQACNTASDPWLIPCAALTTLLQASKKACEALVKVEGFQLPKEGTPAGERGKERESLIFFVFRQRQKEAKAVLVRCAFP